MIFEHFALNVSEPVEMGEWYCQNLGLTMAFEQKEHPFMRFLADSTGRVVCELYRRPEETIINFPDEHPLTFHFAFESGDAEADKQRLLLAGATLVEDVYPPDGSHLVMLRDPWGVSLQLCQRAQPNE